MDGTDSPDVPMDFKHVFLIGKAYRERSRRSLMPAYRPPNEDSFAETTKNLCETAQGAYKTAQKLNEG